MLPSSANHSESSMHTSVSQTTSTSRVSSSVYIPCSSVSLKRINTFDNTSESCLSVAQQQQQTAEIDGKSLVPTTIIATRRKVSKSKDDYKPSRHFVENLQNATQGRRNHSSDSSDNSINHSPRSMTTRSSSMSTSSANDNDCGGGGMKRTAKRGVNRHKNSVLRAKSFSQHIDDSRVVINKQVANPNLMATMYARAENEMKNQTKVRRSASLKNYEDDQQFNKIYDSEHKLKSNQMTSQSYRLSSAHATVQNEKSSRQTDTLSDKRISSSTMNVNQSSTQQTDTTASVKHEKTETKYQTSNLEHLAKLSSKSITSLAYNASTSMRHGSQNDKLTANVDGQSKSSMNADSGFMNVTWSVSNIRKQFEQTSYEENPSMRIRSRATPSVGSTSYYSSMTRVKSVAYTDVHGNPTTYI